MKSIKFLERLGAVTVEIVKEALIRVVKLIGNGIYPVLRVIRMLLPIFCLWLGFFSKEQNTKNMLNTMLLIILFMALVYYLEQLANKLGKGITVPIPKKRFTTEDEQGEVSIPHARLQELILYINDVENWLERKGLL
jgi:hypothetical protein|nr:MAG TPA: hypothetical protein [Caudoviricetes sp.]